MSLIMNWLISLFCLFAWFSLRERVGEAVIWWRRFFLIFSISTFFGGLGHLFFQYTGVYGKIPCWTLGVIAGYCASRGMLSLVDKSKLRNAFHAGLVIKCGLLLILGVWTLNFLFISIDATLSYLVFCGGFGIYLYRKSYEAARYFVIGVLVLLPSAFIFAFKVNLHAWFNKDDLSHVLMMACLFFFFLGAKGLAERRPISNNKN